MKAIYNNMVKSGILGATMLLGFTACTDDHFDVQTGSISGANTIWQNIEANADLDSLAMILRNTPVMRNETDKGKKQSYAELLNSSQEMSMWAPKNGTYHAKYYLDMLDRAAELATIDTTTSRKLYFEVGNEFVRNHIARFNTAAGGGLQSVRLMNSKLCNYDAADLKFNNVKVDRTNYVSSNGMLYTLEGQSPFAYNILDYLGVNPELSVLDSIINSYTEYTFSESASVEGAMNSVGKMEYVDSVYISSNDLLSTTNAFHIDTEDSLYVAIVPSNKAYAQAKEVISPLYKYAKNYWYEWSNSKAPNGGFLYNTGNTIGEVNPNDSLTNINTEKAVVGSMLISPSYFAGINKQDSAAVINYVLYADSLITTDGTILYNKNKDADNKLNPIFDGVTPIKASNGYIFVVDNYNFDPAYTFVGRYEFHTLYSALRSSGSSSTSNRGETTYLTVENKNPEVEGDLEDDMYAYFPFEGRERFDLYLRLPMTLLSANYKVSIITVPNRANLDLIQLDEDENEVEEKPTFTAEILGDDEARIQAVPQVRIQLDQTAIRKQVLWDSAAFPAAYDGLPSNVTSFPLLHIQISNQQRGKAQGVGFGYVILEPVRE